MRISLNLKIQSAKPKLKVLGLALSHFEATGLSAAESRENAGKYPSGLLQRTAEFNILLCLANICRTQYIFR
jgi:hypothetical protein